MPERRACRSPLRTGRSPRRGNPSGYSGNGRSSADPHHLPVARWSCPCRPRPRSRDRPPCRRAAGGDAVDRRSGCRAPARRGAERGSRPPRATVFPSVSEPVVAVGGGVGCVADAPGVAHHDADPRDEWPVTRPALRLQSMQSIAHGIASSRSAPIGRAAAFAGAVRPGVQLRERPLHVAQVRAQRPQRPRASASAPRCCASGRRSPASASKVTSSEVGVGAEVLDLAAELAALRPRARAGSRRRRPASCAPSPRAVARGCAASTTSRRCSRRHERVDLRRRDARVPQQLLHDPDVGAPVEQVGGERMSQVVRGDPALDPRGMSVPRERTRARSDG